MRCRRHPGDVSGDIGVCASCLRERLFSVVVARAELQQDCRRKEARQEYPSFPSSVSPYVSRTTHQRFFSTPQAGAVSAAEIRAQEAENRRRKGRGGRLSSLFWRIFRSKSDKVDPVPESTKQSWTFSLDERSISATRKPNSKPRRNRNQDRGMSPAAVSDDEETEHCRGGPSGYSESSRGWRQPPRRTPACHRRGSVKGTGSGMSFFLSPLIRPSPSRQLKPPPDASACGDTRKTARAHLSTATSFGKSRSRKLAADWRRWNNNNYPED